MADIGKTLREARLRGRIDIGEVEAATKIRAKYLRALENEEWDLLPGPTFVRTFLRTYADYLGLDSRLLVEEYKQSYERPSTQELSPFPSARGGRRARRPRRPLITPGVLVAIGAVVLIGALYALGTLWSDGSNSEESSPSGQATPTATPRGERTPTPTPSSRRRTVRLQIRPTGTVYVCLENVGGRELVNTTLAEGENTRTYRSRRFRVSFGTSLARMRVNGRTYRVKVSSQPVGYEIRPGRRPRELSAAQLPSCGG
jgi:cytoskeleton protein RodZ